MNLYCTHADGGLLGSSRALHRSLAAQAAESELVVLCLDDAAETGWRATAQAGVHLLPLAELLARYPALAAARNDRTSDEFARTCKSWLMRYLLGEIPAGNTLTYVEPTVYFFNSLQSLQAEVGLASLALIPRGLPEAASRDHQGKYYAGWICLRHDATGLACVAEWAEHCLAGCFTLAPTRPRAEEKHLDDWPARYPGAVIIQQAGAVVAPWNLGQRTIAVADVGLEIDGAPLIAFDFGRLVHLGNGLYDPGLHAHAIAPSAILRTQIYLPYLGQFSTEREPDIVPPARADDPRCGPALAAMLGQLQVMSASREALNRDVATLRREARQQVQDARAALRPAQLYISDLERERDEWRTALIATKGKLKKAYADLDHNIACLKGLEAEIAAHAKTSADQNLQIATLCAELNRPGVAADLFNPLQLRLLLEQSRLRSGKLLVAKYHPHLLPCLLALSAAGTPIEVFSSPPEFGAIPPGPLLFRPGSLWEWLGWINSGFSEQAYLQANPDVSAAVAGGAVASGWEHYLMFGQREGRNPGVANYCSGLAEYETLAFDEADAAELIPCLTGRLQAHHKLLISGADGQPAWLPAGINGTRLPGGLFSCTPPPAAWLGPVQPAPRLAAQLPALRASDLYPRTPAAAASWPRITVITVADGPAAHLEAGIRSVLDQNYPNLEFILVDGAAREENEMVLRRYASRLSRLPGEPGRGIVHALNQGFVHATGSILTWLGSDAQLAPGSLFTVAGTFLRDSADLVTGRSARVTHGELPPRRIHRPILPLDHTTSLPVAGLLDLDHSWLPGKFFSPAGTFFRREIFLRAGGSLREDLVFCPEYDLWLRLAKAGAHVRALPEILSTVPEPPEPESSEDESPLLRELRAINHAHQPTA